MSERLCDLGETSIIEKLILPQFPNITNYRNSIDDCAILDIPLTQGINSIVQTSDPCPPPVIFELFDPDFYHYGWLTATINASDLAATGALPFSLSVNIDAPPTMLVKDFTRFIAGLKDASDEYQLPVVGGNIRDQNRFSANGFAIGYLDHDNPLRRANAEQGDIVVAIGNSGHFWSSVLLAAKQGWEQASTQNSQVREALIRPLAKIGIAHSIAKSDLSRCAIDASDGLLGSIRAIAKASDKSIAVDLHTDMIDDWVAEVSNILGVEPYSLLLAWGDWQVVFTTAQADLEKSIDLITNHGFSSQIIGTVTAKNKDDKLVSLFQNGREVNVPDLESRRFDSSSYMTNGLQWWIEKIKMAKLTK